MIRIRVPDAIAIVAAAILAISGNPAQELTLGATYKKGYLRQSRRSRNAQGCYGRGEKAKKSHRAKGSYF
jgi:hypothetical protein